MAAANEDLQFRRATHPFYDATGKFLRPIRVQVAMNGENWTLNPPEIWLEAPGTEFWRQPNFCPAVQYPSRLLAVPPGDFGELLGVAEGLLGRLDTRDRTWFHKCLGGFSHDGLTPAWMQRRNDKRHCSANAMAKNQRLRYPERLRDNGEEGFGFFTNEAPGRRSCPRRGSTKPQSIIGHHRPCRGPGERRWKLSPLVNGAQRIVQENDRRTIIVRWIPAACEDLTAGNRNKGVDKLNGHRDFVLAPNDPAHQLRAPCPPIRILCSAVRQRRTALPGAWLGPRPTVACAG